MATSPVLSVREVRESDIELIANYWLSAKPDFLLGMGVDLSKVPSRENLIAMLSEQLTQSYTEKKSYCIIWEINGKPSGHSNINKIVFGEEAYMHLHLWHSAERQHGTGLELVKRTLPFFFANMNLKTLYCEPYALNPAPNKTLKKLGFEFVKEYITTPGWINFEQKVNLWKLSHSRFTELYGKQ